MQLEQLLAHGDVLACCMPFLECSDVARLRRSWLAALFARESAQRRCAVFAQPPRCHQSFVRCTGIAV